MGNTPLREENTSGNGLLQAAQLIKKHISKFEARSIFRSVKDKENEAQQIVEELKADEVIDDDIDAIVVREQQPPITNQNKNERSKQTEENPQIKKQPIDKPEE